uniref:VKc domain-containing protein n=1 Tax=Ascaris lumbricoides TaxID=6252 RepID=A0A0M3IAD0_ASCLU
MDKRLTSAASNTSLGKVFRACLFLRFIYVIYAYACTTLMQIQDSVTAYITVNKTTCDSQKFLA